MTAEFGKHRAETKLDVANLAKEFGKELREGLAEIRAEATIANRWTWGLIFAVGLAVLFA